MSSSDSLEKKENESKICVAKDVDYSIVASEHIRSFRPFNVAVTLHDHENVVKELSFIHVSIVNKERKTFAEESFEIQVNSTKLVSLDVGELPLDQDFKLLVYATGLVNFRYKAALQHASKTVAILIQTDKPRYKPGDLLQFRVLVLDSQLKAADLQSKKLCVHLIVRNKFLGKIRKIINFHLLIAGLKYKSSKTMGKFGNKKRCFRN